MNYIQDQINSILLQSNVDVQLFISVDQSTDGTEVRLAERALSESRLRLLPFGQRFGGAGPNFYRLLRDVDLTGFDYLSFADQDDLWHPEKLWRAHSTRAMKAMIKRRSAIEPAIGHMKMDGKLSRNPLKGELGDALHAVMCGAGHNMRMLLRKLRLLCAQFGLNLQTVLQDISPSTRTNYFGAV
ncbi:hypothetical protein MCERE1_02781 [Burkholderiaceae bacterium]